MTGWDYLDSISVGGAIQHEKQWPPVEWSARRRRIGKVKETLVTDERYKRTDKNIRRRRCRRSVCGCTRSR